ncbi:hypothetical protein EV360DRAFT_78705 [Lentinula raphanica]|nr:hypothetical protein EV360DRAFT_78705 [Lentinula raphanica]
MFSKLLTATLTSILFFSPTNALPTRYFNHPFWSGVAVSPQQEKASRRFPAKSLSLISLTTLRPPKNWVGIDGHDPEHFTLLNARIHCKVDPHGVVKCFAFAQWFPQALIRYDESDGFDRRNISPKQDLLDLEPGDRVGVVVELGPDGRKGSVTMTNISKGKVTYHPMPLPLNATPVKGGQAEWIVQIPSVRNFDGSKYASSELANFREVTFSDCYAKTDRENMVDLSKLSRGAHECTLECTCHS